MSKGYFNNKKITKVYVGSDVIYKEEVIEPLFIIGSDFVPSSSKVMMTVTKKNGKTSKAVVGEPFYKGDKLRIIVLDWSLKFRGAPTYIPEGSSSKIPFETKTSNQEYATKFPQGYSGGLSYPTTRT